MKRVNGWGSAFLVCTLTALAGCGAGPSVQTFDPTVLSAQVGLPEAPFILDVRSANEFAAGHIPQAMNIPHDELLDRISELPTDFNATIVVHCHAGPRAEQAEAILLESGYTDVHDLDGHWRGWVQENRPQQ
ncbi:MAG: rhodanese-like domain-containing protein [Myxococcota bacterium]|nr:rhodanese-like domain-containing protein [Myxococcota bacterium]